MSCTDTGIQVKHSAYVVTNIKHSIYEFSPISLRYCEKNVNQISLHILT